jgi:hypothetical protein
MIVQMLLATLNTVLASVFVSLNLAAPRHLKALTYDDTENPETCVRYNHDFIIKICTYPGQTNPCFYESFGINGKNLSLSIFLLLIHIKNQKQIPFLGTIRHQYNIEKMAKLLCDRSIESYQIMEQYCCLTQKCLFWSVLFK